MDINFSKKEKSVLKFWEENKIFEQSLAQRKKSPHFSFYDGPPFATGEPHYGHLLPSTIKDVVLRFWTMKGFYAPRRFGWDCHGLPVENLAEAELKIKDKTDIEKIGIGKFNETCRKLVFRHLATFEKILRRIGRWGEYENHYATLTSDYTESVWWVFKQLYKQDLIYKDYRVTPYCPHCGTPLSNFELNQPGAYQDQADETIYFKVSLEKDPSTYLLVWTTTPWTIPANTGVAVNPEEDYIKVKIGKDCYILALTRKELLVDQEYEIIEQFKGEKLLGQKYKPLYEIAPLRKDDYRIVGAEWVTMEEGTGLVHIAPAFGENDMILGQKEGLSTKITVDAGGKIKDGLSLPGEGESVWAASEKMVEDLQKKGLLWKKETISHSYPFCWRCDTRLIYYPIDSWYIAVEKFRKQLVANNQKINWVPSHLKDGRFGKWLAGAKDWSISRSRYWGAPLPVWFSETQKEIEVIGSREDLRKQLFTTNHYWLLRHGQAESNVKHLVSSAKDKHPLTNEGRKQIEDLIPVLKQKKIDIIIASDVLRAKETAEIISKALNLHLGLFSEISEIKHGVFEEESLEKYYAFYNSELEKLTRSPNGGETGNQVKKRAFDFLKKIDQQYKKKNILIISHRGVFNSLEAASQGLTQEEISEMPPEQDLKTAELRSWKFNLFPYNSEGVLDFHRPYIDEIKFYSPQGEVMTRITDVFDCWFESGSMPYAQDHYPFKNKALTESMFPADFVAEAIDQTRGWFYTLNVLSTALTLKDIGFGENLPAFRNVIVNGLIVGEGGQKLSKHLKNYVDPNLVLEKYGADTLRFFLLTNSPMGNNFSVSEEGIKEIFRKSILTLWHCFSYYETYPEGDFISSVQSPKNILDRWILSRLNKINKQVTEEMEQYQVGRATRLFISFIDDLSNWYIRRSRNRFQSSFPSEREEVSQVLGSVLFKLSQMIAPFLPFLGESIYSSLIKKTKDSFPVSVHLTDYPKANLSLINESIEEEMKMIMQIASLGLKLRAQAGIKIRQPLSELRIGNLEEKKLSKEAVALLKEELNIKQIVFAKLTEDDDWETGEDNNIQIGLKKKISIQLRKEGSLREIIHAVQMLRKDGGLKASHRITLYIQGTPEIEKLIDDSRDLILEENRAEMIVSKSQAKGKLLAQKNLKINSKEIWLGINQN